MTFFTTSLYLIFLIIGFKIFNFAIWLTYFFHIFVDVKLTQHSSNLQENCINNVYQSIVPLNDNDFGWNILRFQQITTSLYSPSDVIFLLIHHISKCNKLHQISRNDTNKLKQHKTTFVSFISGILHKHNKKRVKQPDEIWMHQENISCIIRINILHIVIYILSLNQRFHEMHHFLSLTHNRLSMHLTCIINTLDSSCNSTASIP